MRIFISDVSSLYAQGIGASRAVRALLSYAVEKTWGIGCPEIEKRGDGKPYFVDAPHKFLSLSHSKSHVLVALSDYEVGADIETLREPKADGTRLFGVAMLEEFGYFGSWTLRESVFKLCGKGSLRSMEIRKHGGEIIAPIEGLRCRLYSGLPGCIAAAACLQGEFPDEPEAVEVSAFWT